jgi:glycosyltransferase involved in cell wall biosynthesis
MANLQEVSELYNCLDLYLVTSRHEGGPQALLECSLNKTPILSTDVGMANEVLTKECLMQGPEEFLDSIHSKTFDHSNENYQRVQKFKLENLFDQYVNLLKAA